PFECTFCLKRFRKAVHLKAHLEIHSYDKPYKCRHCGKGFRQSSYLSAHKRTHLDKKPFKCDECGKMFGKRTHLKHHQFIHSGEKPYKCSECDSCFRQVGHLNDHLGTHRPKQLKSGTNAGVKIQSFICVNCKKQFTLKSTLVRHMKTHTGAEKPFKCAYCGKGFWRSFDMKDHHRRIHS
ncbi:predicted protein, partial [Nematostella vectensis]